MSLNIRELALISGPAVGVGPAKAAVIPSVGFYTCRRLPSSPPLLRPYTLERLRLIWPAKKKTGRLSRNASTYDTKKRSYSPGLRYLTALAEKPPAGLSIKQIAATLAAPESGKKSKFSCWPDHYLHLARQHETGPGFHFRTHSSFRFSNVPSFFALHLTASPVSICLTEKKVIR